MPSLRPVHMTVVVIVSGLPGLKPTSLDGNLVVARGRSRAETAARVAAALCDPPPGVSV
jgi:hypothetical protein